MKGLVLDCLNFARIIYISRSLASCVNYSVIEFIFIFKMRYYFYQNSLYESNFIFILISGLWINEAIVSTGFIPIKEL